MSLPPGKDHLVCTACGHEEPIDAVPSTCSVCDGILDLVLGAARQEPGDGLWRWAEHLPQVAPRNRVFLGEAGTPLVAAHRLGARLGTADLWIKNESLQPTGSFKDRALALATSLAVEYRRPGVVLSSSGNAGASAAAYAARAGLPAVVLVPASASHAKLKQILIAGARLLTIDGATSDCCALARQVARELDFVNVTTTFYCPYGVDAYATIACELASAAPDVVVLPVSSGPILAGVMKGFERLHARGAVGRIPRPVAVQSSACRPIVDAFETGRPTVSPPHRPTVAAALNDTLAGYERDGDHTLHFLRKHAGTAIAVDDAEILEATALLARTEGIAVEPSAAAPVAALPRLLASGFVRPGDRVVAVATGHALKDMPDEAWPPMPDPMRPDIAAVVDRIRMGRR
jgi:threonine synthase